MGPRYSKSSRLSDLFTGEYRRFKAPDTGNNREFFAKKCRLQQYQELSTAESTITGNFASLRGICPLQARLATLIFPKSHGLAHNCKRVTLKIGGAGMEIPLTPME